MAYRTRAEKRAREENPADLYNKAMTYASEGNFRQAYTIASRLESKQEYRKAGEVYGKLSQLKELKRVISQLGKEVSGNQTASGAVTEKERAISALSRIRKELELAKTGRVK